VQGEKRHRPHSVRLPGNAPAQVRFRVGKPGLGAGEGRILQPVAQIHANEDLEAGVSV
jgi:hypothetical protein